MKSNRIAQFLALSLGLGCLSWGTAVLSQTPPSKQFIQRDVPLVWIFNEWYDKAGNQIPMYVCVCTKADCDLSQGWPFRQFSVGDSIPALGPTNRNDAERQGFICGQVPPSELPFRGIGG